MEENLITTQEAADLISKISGEKISAKTVAKWRYRKLFGVPFFSADEKRGQDWYYNRERVLQLAAVYQKGILQNMYKLARKFEGVELSEIFQIGETSRKLEKVAPKYFPADEVAKILGVTEMALTKWRDSGKFVEDLVDHDGTFWYSAQRVYEFQAERDPSADLIAEIAEVCTKINHLTDTPQVKFYRRILTQIFNALKAGKTEFDVSNTSQSASLSSELREAGLCDAVITQEVDEINGTDIYETWTVKNLKEVEIFVASAQKFLQEITAQKKSSRADETARKENVVQKKSELTKEQRAFLFSGEDTDYDNARRITCVFKDKLRYLTDSDKWATYDGAKWTVAGDARISTLEPFVSLLASKMKDAAISPQDRKFANIFKKAKKTNPAIAKLKGVHEILITRADLDTHKNLLNCKNGVVDLETKKLYPHAPELLLTQQAAATFRADYHNETVEKFLRDVLPDEQTRAAFLRFIGYGLTGSINEEKALFVYGDGGNGKGTFFQTLSRLMNNYATAFPIKAILARFQTKDANAATPAFNQLELKRLAIAEEILQGEKLDTATFKLLTGGDPIPIRRLHEEGTVIDDPTHKMIFSGNHLPELYDARDKGLIRRLLVIQFTQTFDESNCDVYLKQKLLTPDALSGLLTLLVDHAAAWYKEGLLSSPAMVQTKNEYLQREDFVAEFIEENCVKVATGVIPLKDFINRLRDNSTAARRMTDRALRDTVSRTLAAMKDVEKKKLHGGVYKIIGLGWLTDNTDDNLLDREFETVPVPATDIPFGV